MYISSQRQHFGILKIILRMHKKQKDKRNNEALK
jgi:hypothetical protein